MTAGFGADAQGRPRVTTGGTSARIAAAPSLRPLLLVCAAGVALRFVFLLLAGELELQSDEANYVYLAATWEYFGFYSDSYRYLWPPGYPWLLGLAMRAFEAGGIFAVKLLQVAASASVGWFTMLLARRLFGQRAALLAGALWCVYLPLVAFTHYLWTETLFLALLCPALYLLLVSMQEPEARRDGARIVAAGGLFGLALYLKEVHLYLAPVLALLLATFEGRQGWSRGVRRGSLFLLSIAVLVAPWTLRNYEVYGRFIPVGASLGENCYLGLNATYKNFDTTPFARHRLDTDLPEHRAWFVQVDAEPWERAEEIVNTHDKTREGVRRGLAFARAHPGWFVRSRIKKLADFVVPLSFFTRHQGLEHYAASVLGKRPVRRALVVASVALSAAVMLLGLAGFLAVLGDRSARWLLTTVALYFVATVSIVAMSRFRIPLTPLLIVLAAGWLTAHPPAPRRALALAAAVLVLGGLWWVDLPELRGSLALAWRGSPESTP